MISKFYATTYSALAVFALALAAAPDADAGCHRRARRARVCPPPPRCAPLAAGAVSPAAPAAASPQAAAQAPGDPLGWLNAQRSALGLAPVGYDAGLAGWAGVNNGQQQARGLGHHVMGAARRQNVGVGDFGQVVAMWWASPAHASALMDPTISRAAVVGSGAYWTFVAF